MLNAQDELVVSNKLAAKQIPMKMTDWIQKLDAFLIFNEYDILQDAGKVRHDVAIWLAKKKYERFRIAQDKNKK